MNFRPEMFLNNLHYLVVGMAGIFIVIGVIILASVIMNVIGKK